MSALTDQDRTLIESGVDKFILEQYPFDERELRREEDGKFGKHWPTFAELGWLMLPFAEEAGGMGGAVVDAQVLTRAFGRGLIAEPWLEAMMAGKVLERGAETVVRDQWLTPLVSGELVLILAHGERKADLNFSAVECAAELTDSGYRLNGTKRVVWQAGAADKFLVTALIGEEPAVFIVDRAAAGVTLSEFSSVDSRYAADIEFSNVVLAADALVCRGTRAEIGVKRAILFAFGALVGEMRGIAEQLIALTAEYMNTREQFGTAIGNFQALQHMLADMVIAKEEIQSLEWITAELATIDDLDERERIARAAKARAATVGRKLCEIGVQLHGGVGLTDEYVASHYLRRMIAIDALYGDAQQQLLWLAGRY